MTNPQINNTIQITEWHRFCVEDLKGCKDQQKTFELLCDFVKGEGNGRFLQFSGPSYLKTQNYVGLIQTKNGVCIEILPKIHETNSDIGQSKEVLLNMLRTLRDSPFKRLDISNLKASKFPLLEVFVIMFLDELGVLIRQGIKSKYVAEEQNRHFLKGKLLFLQNIRQNLIHKERFFTSSDEYIQNIPQNRLIASTIALLQKQCFSAKTNSRLLEVRAIFEEIPKSLDYKSDFAKCKKERSFLHYENLLCWCNLFLQNMSWKPYSGSSEAFALLFPMETLFESYVAYELKKHCKDKGIKSQHRSKYMLSGRGKRFALKPDIVVSDGRCVEAILDTKWKIIEGQNDISQSDVYQVFAYGANYLGDLKDGRSEIEVMLIYPKIEGIDVDFEDDTFVAKFNENKKVKFCVRFWDLLENDPQNQRVIKDINNKKTQEI